MNKKMKVVFAAATLSTILIAGGNYYRVHNSSLKEYTYNPNTASINEKEEFKLDENIDMQNPAEVSKIEPAIPQVTERVPVVVSRGTSISNRTSAPSPKPTATPKPIPKQTPKPSITVNSSSGISKEERELFARLVSAEAAGESFEGKLAVATVIINRVKSSLFANTITGVIYGKEGGYYQFSPVQDGRINEAATADSVKAVDMVLNGHRSFGPNIMWFLNPRKAVSSWIIENKTFFKSIGNHDFYY